MAKCIAATKDGDPCSAEALQDGDGRYCFVHSPDPEVADRRAEARRLGGYRAHAVRGVTDLSFDVSTLEATLKTLNEIGKAIAEGRADRAVGNSLGFIASQAAKVHSLRNMEVRIARLERALRLKVDVE